jgi:hypothetical protein
MIKISKMSGKLDGLMAINTSPLNNPFCMARHKNKVGICGECYSTRMLKTFRSNCNNAYVYNGEVLSERILPKKYLPFINQAYFRFQAHGELINENHLINLINICKRNPACTFALWTKRKALYNKVITQYGKPLNLIAIYSEPKINHITQKPPQGFDKVFCVIDDNTPVNCKSRCINCLKCYKKTAESVIVERIK